MEVIATQSFDALLEDYVKEVIGQEQPRIPPFKSKLGHVDLAWFECAPGIAHLSASGGTVDDRELAQRILQAELEAEGFKRAAYTFQWDRDDPMTKTAGWPDIEAKAKRLISDGKVQILRNSPNTVVGHVEGDHGTYQTEISRDDPNSQAITLWQCECDWDQFAWQRTRQWKKYEGRPCSHVLATYWKSQATPLDEESEPGEGPSTPNASPPGGAAPIVQGEPSFQPSMAPGQASPGSQAPMPPGVAAPPPELMPQFPGNPALQPAINPVSVPGQKPQTPLNPVQNAGGTFSSWKMADGPEFNNGDMVMLKNEEIGTAVGLNPGEQVTIPKNSIGEVLGVDPTTGLVNVYYAGPMAERGRMEPHGVTAWHWPNDVVPRSDVRPPGPAIRRRR